MADSSSPIAPSRSPSTSATTAEPPKPISNADLLTLGAQIAERGLKMTLELPDGKTVQVSSTELENWTRNPNEFQKFGLTRNDFAKALQVALERNEDISIRAKSAAGAVFFDGKDGNVDGKTAAAALQPIPPPPKAVDDIIRRADLRNPTLLEGVEIGTLQVLAFLADVLLAPVEIGMGVWSMGMLSEKFDALMPRKADSASDDGKFHFFHLFDFTHVFVGPAEDSIKNTTVAALALADGGRWADWTEGRSQETVVPELQKLIAERHPGISEARQKTFATALYEKLNAVPRGAVDAYAKLYPAGLTKEFSQAYVALLGAEIGRDVDQKHQVKPDSDDVNKKYVAAFAQAKTANDLAWFMSTSETEPQSTWSEWLMQARSPELDAALQQNPARAKQLIQLTRKLQGSLSTLPLARQRDALVVLFRMDSNPSDTFGAGYVIERFANGGDKEVQSLLKRSKDDPEQLWYDFEHQRYHFGNANGLLKFASDLDRSTQERLEAIVTSADDPKATAARLDTFLRINPSHFETYFDDVAHKSANVAGMNAFFDHFQGEATTWLPIQVDAISDPAIGIREARIQTLLQKVQTVTGPTAPLEVTDVAERLRAVPAADLDSLLVDAEAVLKGQASVEQRKLFGF